MPDRDNPTPGTAPVASPRPAPLKSLHDSALELRAAFAGLPPDRQEAAMHELPEIVAGGPFVATGDDVIDDLGEIDFDDPRYLILDSHGGCDA